MDLHHGWPKTSFSFVTAADRIFRTNQNNVNVQSQMCGGRITASSAPGQVMERNWADEDRDQAHRRFCDWVAFSSEVRVKKRSVQCYEHIGFCPHFPLKYKTKSTPTPSPNLKKGSHTVQNPHIRTLGLQCWGPWVLSTVTRKETPVKIRTHPAQ